MTQEELTQRLQEIESDIENYVSDTRERYVFHNEEGNKKWQSIERREQFLEHCLRIVQRDVISLQEDIHN